MVSGNYSVSRPIFHTDSKSDLEIWVEAFFHQDNDFLAFKRSLSGWQRAVTKILRSGSKSARKFNSVTQFSPSIFRFYTLTLSVFKRHLMCAELKTDPKFELSSLEICSYMNNQFALTRHFIHPTPLDIRQISKLIPTLNSTSSKHTSTFYIPKSRNLIYVFLNSQSETLCTRGRSLFFNFDFGWITS